MPDYQFKLREGWEVTTGTTDAVVIHLNEWPSSSTESIKLKLKQVSNKVWHNIQRKADRMTRRANRD